MSNTIISSQQGTPLQRRRRRASDWTEAQRRTFLDTLADSCNVRMAARAAGKSQPAVYRLRERDPEFAAHWQEALRIGYERLETALLRRALRIAGAEDHDGTAWTPAETDRESPAFADMTVAQAMDLLAKHKASVAHGHGTRIDTRRVPTCEQVDELILLRIAVLKRQRERLS